MARDGAGVGMEVLGRVVGEHERESRPVLDLLWRYYRNELRGRGLELGGGYRLGQRWGLPARLVGSRGAHLDDRMPGREIVIENDIAWRVHTMVDFMFGKPVRLTSTARSEETRERVGAILDAVWERSGGIALLQDLGLLGHVYGHADMVLRVDGAMLSRLAGEGEDDPRIVSEAMRVEVVDPTRGVPVLNERDYRTIDAFVIREASGGARESAASGPAGRLSRRGASAGPAGWMEVLSATWRGVHRDGVLVEEEELWWTGGRVPVVHVQNVPQPFRYSGLSEVEALVPLQDELNTRLSDRASRVTMQCFKMYLAKGIEGFERMPVGPGQVWSTDNPSASVEAFGGDASSPSEEAHIKEIRDALDKASGVPPLATGVVQGRVGNLSSANALKITLVGLLGKTERKRTTYGRGIAEMSRLVLTALDASGVLATARTERGVRLEWPDPLPTDVLEETLAAKRKLELGVPGERVLDELGYESRDAGVA